MLYGMQMKMSQPQDTQSNATKNTLDSLIKTRANLEMQIDAAYRAHLVKILNNPEKKITCTAAEQRHVVSAYTIYIGEFSCMDLRQRLILDFMTPAGKVCIDINVDNFENGRFRRGVRITNASGATVNIEDCNEEERACYDLVMANYDELRLLAKKE